MIAQHEVITSYITQEDTHFVEPIVFGTSDPHKIAGLIDTFCQEELGAHVANFLFYESSVGAVCGAHSLRSIGKFGTSKERVCNMLQLSRYHIQIKTCALNEPTLTCLVHVTIV